MQRTLILFSLLLSLFASAAIAENWHQDAFFGLHYDLHAGATDTELGRETTYEHIRAMLEKVQPDFVQYDCKGHPGYAGYPTEVGSPSPGIVNDALAIWRQVTRDMGIPLSIHYSGVWDARAIELHPEWARRTPEGNPDKNNTCRLSGYDAELMIPQLLEVVRKYDVDGMWIDGENWASKPCWCERCTAAFTEKTGINEVPKNPGDANWFDWLQFYRDLFTQHVTNYVNAVHAEDPECMVTSNWMYSVRQPEPVAAPIDWLSGDFDPSFGAERACAEARFLSSRGLPWDLMAWSFLRTGSEQWTFKTAPHLCQEIAQVLGQGGAVFIYDVPQRSGRLTEWHQDVLGQVADFCRARKEFSFQTQTLPQVAILHSETTYYQHNEPLFNFGHGNQAVEGALHAVLENGYSADLLNEQMLLERIGQYPVVIVPERELLPENVQTALRSYVEQGGRLLMSGAHVSAQFAELTGTAPVEGSQHGGVFLPADEGAVTVAGAWQVVSLNGAEAIAGMLNQQDPNVNRLDAPSATRHRLGSGIVVAIHGPTFESYHAAHYPRLRRYIGDRIAELESPGLMHRQGPWSVEIAARQKDGKRLIQLINRATDGYTAPNRHMVEHVPDAGAFTLSIPLAERPTRCYMAPEADGLEWTWKDGVLTAQIGGLGIHSVLVIE
jgi:hypothetical protein